MDTSTRPYYRRLRGYAIDPSFSLSADTIAISERIYEVLWEENPELTPGPCGEYLEVTDVDESGNLIHEPLDLSFNYLVAEDGLKPSESNYFFHQQMVYAVAMTTIQTFERCLGRAIQWNQQALHKIDPPGPDKHNSKKQTKKSDNKPTYIRRLKLLPHGIADENAYYSPTDNSIKFGYFKNKENSGGGGADMMVYTCLSHDIIAHELTHAIVHGRFGAYADFASNMDTLAFHEAFADLIALFQRITFPSLAKQAIINTKGNLTDVNFLVELAHQFGTAIGKYRSLRNAIGEIDEKTGKWKKNEASYADYANRIEPIDRGQLLVSTIFEAFTIVYEQKKAALVRIATGGSGVLKEGELPPDLVNLLTEELVGVAGKMLRMCIRALDYCPPSDITFGDFLRAIITADMDLEAEDSECFRVALIESFRKRNIVPEGVIGYSEDSLRYQLYTDNEEVNDLFKEIAKLLQTYRNDVITKKKREDIYKLTRSFIDGDKEKNIKGLHELISCNDKLCSSIQWALLTGLVFNKKASEEMGAKISLPKPFFEIQSLHLASRVSKSGKRNNAIVLSLLQYLLVAGVKNSKGRVTKVEPVKEKDRRKKVALPGGCTLIFDLDTLKLKYAISKPLTDTDALQKGVYKLNAKRSLDQYKYIISQGWGVVE